MDASPELPITRAQELLSVRLTADKGRGVFARSSIPANTLLESSPVLLIPSDQYTAHSFNRTVIESYAFTWARSSTTPSMALALGLGSMFNHDEERPNVSFQLDKANEVIRYKTTREVKEGEELCIYYGHGVTFGENGELVSEGKEKAQLEQRTEEQVLQDMGGLVDSDEDMKEEQDGSYASSEDGADDEEIIKLEDLPLKHVTAHLKPEDIPLETREVYALTIDPRQTNLVVKFLKDHDLDQIPELKHCRRVRKSDDSTAQILLCPAAALPYDELSSLLSASPSLTSLTPFPPIPHILHVPAFPARTPTQVRLLSASHWPVSLVPLKDDVLALHRETAWSRGRLRWARACLKEVIKLAEEAKERGEVGVACAAATSWQPRLAEDGDAQEVGRRKGEQEGRKMKGQKRKRAEQEEAKKRRDAKEPAAHNRKGKGRAAAPAIVASATDTRNSSCNPLSHCVMNLLAQIAALDLASSRHTVPTASTSSAVSSISASATAATPATGPLPISDVAPAPAQAYLLTGHTVFLTHEPCILCSMALLHSRIATLIYVRSSPGAGGCGSVYGMHELKGTNHRFEVWKVKEEEVGRKWLRVEGVEDVGCDP